jgi:hypothetical protein
MVDLYRKERPTANNETGHPRPSRITVKSQNSEQPPHPEGHNRSQTEGYWRFKCSAIAQYDGIGIISVNTAATRAFQNCRSVMLKSTRKLTNNR